MAINSDIKKVVLILCFIEATRCFLVDNDEHLILQMKQEIDTLKSGLAQVTSAQQTTQTELTRVKLEKQAVQNELFKVKTELSQIKSNIQQNTHGNHHVAFMASLSHDLENPAVGHQIVFDNVHLNKGNGYNNRHGIFVAPLNGTYHYSLEITYLPDQPHDHNTGVYLKKKTENIAYVYSEGTWENLIRRSTSAIVELNVGDDVYAEVSVVKGRNNTIKGDPSLFLTTISGFLIS